MGSRGNYCRLAHPAAANDVGVDTAAANFGLLIVPRPITNRQQRTLCVRTRVSAMRATAAVTIGNRTGELHVCGVDQWCTDRDVYPSCCSSSNVDSQTGDCASSRPFQRQYFITCKREEILIQRLYIGYCCSTPRSTAASINLGCRNGKLHVCVV